MRIIPRLDVKNDNLIKTICLEGLRKIGNPNEFARKYADQGADELLFMDLVASLYGRNNLFDIINNISKDIFIPITVGGGVRCVSDATKLLENGADKVLLNSATFSNRELISNLANQIGSSSVVLSIEAKKINEDWYAFYNSGRENSKVTVKEWIKEGIAKGAGEICITSVDREGTEEGFDLELLKKIKLLNIKKPLIISGGISGKEDIREIKKIIDCSAVSVASVLHYNKKKVNDLRI
jgi:cyclase